jgi:hypothetical protein
VRNRLLHDSECAKPRRPHATEPTVQQQMTRSGYLRFPHCVAQMPPRRLRGIYTSVLTRNATACPLTCQARTAQAPAGKVLRDARVALCDLTNIQLNAQAPALGLGRGDTNKGPQILFAACGEMAVRPWAAGALERTGAAQTRRPIGPV